MAQITSKPGQIHTEKSSRYCVPQNVIISTGEKLLSFLDTQRIRLLCPFPQRPLA